MKKKLEKIIFILSFLPYILILLISLYVAIFGDNVYTISGEKYGVFGLDVFLNWLTELIYVYCVWIPILPVVAIYQVIYLMVKRRR